ncbi:hypothetical protein [Sinorhizobium meliloti]|uniref:hypothetical protein n=1 Tax=Rhizobium meliloti TaxID=382 RepID=UPI0012FD1A79|nr:hypothetical protein [Sinorhizobium meliloti]
MKPIILQPGPQAWLSSSILSAYQDRYVARLREDRYAHNVIRVYLASVAHFARWLDEQHIGLSSLCTAVMSIMAKISSSRSSTRALARRWSGS